jgi:hydroxymethylglutaryl-CoA lyase
VTEIRKAVNPLPVRVHFHNTRNTGLANVWAAVGAGARVVDASLGGLGGCPFAPGASGNIVMEDLCFMLDSMGLITGVDLEKLLLVREIAAQNLASNLMTGALARAGLPKHYKTAQERSTVSA